MNKILNLKYLKSICIGNLVSLTLLIATIVYSILCSIYKVEVLFNIDLANKTELVKWFLPIASMFVFWFMMFIIPMFLISMFDIIGFTNYIKENKEIWNKKYYIGYIPFVSFLLWFILEKKVKLENKENSYFNFKSRFLAFSFYFGFILATISGALILELSLNFENVVKTIVIIFTIYSVWTIFMFLVIGLYSIVLLVIAIVHMLKDDVNEFYFGENNMKRYLFFPIIAGKKQLSVATEKDKVVLNFNAKL